jgi:hypothetical protein
MAHHADLLDPAFWQGTRSASWRATPRSDDLHRRFRDRQHDEPAAAAAT